MSGDGRNPRLTEWVWITLGDIRVDRARSILPSRSPEEAFELYSVPSFASGVPEIVKGREIGSNKQTVETGTVLLCKINPRINRSWIVGDRSDSRKIASTEWIPFFPIKGVDPSYLCYYMRLDVFRNHLAANVSGVGGSLMRARLWSIESYPFPLAPLPEQRRIVAEIEKHLTRLDGAVASLQRARANLKRYRASVLRAACEGRLVPTEAELARREGRGYEPAAVLPERILKERRARQEAQERRRGRYKEPQPPDTADLPSLPEGWVWATLEQLAANEPFAITDGPFGSNLKTSHYTPSGARVIRLQNVGDGRFVDERAYVSMEHFNSLRKHHVHSRDIIIAALGQELPRACVVPGFIGPAMVKADCIRFRLDPRIAVPEFLNYVLNAESTGKRTSKTVHGVGRPRLNLQEIKAIAVPVPSLAEQQRIVAEAERRLSAVEATEMAIEANLKRADRLRQAILRRAFEGKLVPQDPSDEPASVLLERIRAEREQSGRNISEARRGPGRRRKAQGVSA